MGLCYQDAGPRAHSYYGASNLLPRVSSYFSVASQMPETAAYFLQPVSDPTSRVS